MSRKTKTFALVGGVMLAFVLGADAAASFNADSRSEATLKDAFKSDFLIGAAINRDQIFETDARSGPILVSQFSSISPENVLKWGLIHPRPGQYDFAPADRYVEFGEKHGMFIVGHTLVWHNQTPDWVFKDDQGRPVDRETILARLHDHIKTVGGRYRGRIKGWDVVNEA